MKKLLTISIVALLSACGNNDFESAEARNILEDLSITIDTVMIDSRGKILDMRRGYSESSISEDRKYVFLYNSHSYQIQQINLDKLVWEKDYDFEVEGPNGISTMVFSTRYLGEDQFLITSYRRLGIFDASGSKDKELSISSLPISSDLDELDYGIILSKDQKSLFSIPGTRFMGSRSFARVDLESFEIKEFSIPELDWITDLKVVYMGGYSFQETLHLHELNNQILISSPASAAFYRYDQETDSLTYHSFVHKLSPVANDIQLKWQVESIEEYSEEMGRFFGGMFFGPLIWDEKRELYFRFSRKPTEMDSLQQIISSEIFLHAYDQKFTLIGESLLPIFNRPTNPFFKDGKLWSYVNVDDELGFAVFTFDF
ncbi:DUF4221 family protein [Algoriphagus antarcticus]|uniref:Uncharacterized protein DUF4221 n=1 Tax=Algoriphagus antarcticus TaxID=238540 RepID=A0A3E0DRZ7_9BACT|nr:DUF4221 family protein [Algoriphagus antarcticus]REG86303.1 uncharacterized protein DUF4221 [Algoriphagus antarcticus]